jgi:acetyltransferase-like isoleucine patch superfamily enzyme
MAAAVDRAAAYQLTARLRDRLLTMWLAPGFGTFGPRCRVHGPIRLAGAKNMHFGTGVHLGPDCWLMALEGARISIGTGCRFQGSATVAAWECIEFGEDVLVGRHTHFMDCHHRTDREDLTIRQQGFLPPQPIRIGDGAWIGHNAVVLPGVTIGRNARIGANAVVSRDVPDYTTVVGVPARPLGEAVR